MIPETETGPRPTRHVFTCEPGWEAALAEELRRTFAGYAPTAVHELTTHSGRVELVGIHLPGEELFAATPTIAFARQYLPNVAAIEAESIGRWADVICEAISARLDGVDVPWRLHLFSALPDEASPVSRRGELIRAKLLEKLKRVRIRLLRRLNVEAEAPWLEGEALVQVALTSPTAGFVSILEEPTRRVLRRVVSRFIGGAIEPAVDKLAPSRAFAKLVEVECRMNRQIRPDETCVDLGASPGSWTYTALRHGARVTALDRSPLRDDLMRNPRLTFLQKDAFRWSPPEPVDWLLSDIIAYPERIRELLTAWLGSRHCRLFCVTVKFRGRDDDAELESVKRGLAASGYEFCVRRLNANKNEATAYGYLPDGIELKAGAGLT